MIRPVAILATGLLTLLAAAPAAAAERGFQVGSFDRLTLEGSSEVTVVTGKAASVRATGDAEALDRLDVRVEGGILKIGRRREASSWSWGSHGHTRLAVTVPMLRGVEIAGSGSVAVDRIKAGDFAANLAGSGGVDVAQLDADRTSFVVSGSGTMTAAGRCGTGSAKINGSGGLKLAGLKCTTLSASIAGSGSIDAFATQTATLSSMGSGDITLAGGARCTTSTAGSGRVRCS